MVINVGELMYLYVRRIGGVVYACNHGNSFCCICIKLLSRARETVV